MTATPIKPDRRRKRLKSKRSQNSSPEYSKAMRKKPITAYRRYLESQLANTI